MALAKALGGGGGGSALTVKDEGSTLSTAVTSIDFVGAGVTATNVGGAVTATIPGGTPAEVLISAQTPSGTGTVTFSSISGAYRDLRVVVRGRGTKVANTAQVALRFNADSGANYDRTVESSTGGFTGFADSFGQTSLVVGQIAAASATANIPGSTNVRIFDYSGTTFHKSTDSLCNVKWANAANGMSQEHYSGAWRSTSAITQVDVILDSGNFVAGSVVSLYGIL